MTLTLRSSAGHFQSRLVLCECFSRQKGAGEHRSSRPWAVPCRCTRNLIRFRSAETVFCFCCSSILSSIASFGAMVDRVLNRGER
jgi:hypothetical protein